MGRLEMSFSRFLSYFIVLGCASGLAQDHDHGTTEKLGTVHFSTSCKAEAQTEFDRSVALLHSFQFSRAIQGFRTTLTSDPNCGIAYWGIALSQWSNPFAAGQKDKLQLDGGRANAELAKKTGSPSPRERSYIDAVSNLYRDFEDVSQHARLIAYRDAMSDVAAKYPDDDEAQVFYALSIAASEDLADKTYTGRLKAGAILEKLFEREPDHPGLAHYIIHTYDVPPLAGRALVAARRYAEIAPDAPHALHMPSHTFTRTGYWQESINTNIAAAASAKREGQTAEELHASDYEIYAYLQTGQDEAARKIVDSLPEIQSRFDPKTLISGAGGPSAGYFAVAAIPARFALERGDWKQASQLVAHETPFPYTEAMTWFARGLGSARLSEAKPALDAAASLKKIHDQLVKAGENYWALQVEIQQREIEAWATLAQGDKREALRQMEAAAKLEDGTEKSAITPGPVAPARELLGEMLLASNQPEAALAQFEGTMKKEPGRFRTLYGAAKAAQIAGRNDDSRRYFNELLKVCEKADRPGRTELQQAKKAVGKK
jgi:tetratricopeptide (TPR) repeat protein